MKLEQKNALALVAVSLPFFTIFTISMCMLILVLLYPVLSVIKVPIDPMGLLALIALCGGILFLSSTREENPAWYLGVPLVAALGMMALNPILTALIVIHDPSPPIWHPGILWSLLAGAGVIFLLPLGTALFFWSQRQRVRWAPWITAIALLVAVNAAILAFFTLSPWLVTAGIIPPPQPLYIDGHLARTDGEGLLFLFVHMYLGLPLLGICILLLAVAWWRAGQHPSP